MKQKESGTDFNGRFTLRLDICAIRSRCQVLLFSTSLSQLVKLNTHRKQLRVPQIVARVIAYLHPLMTLISVD